MFYREMKKHKQHPREQRVIARAAGCLILLGILAFSLATRLTLGRQTDLPHSESLSKALLGDVRIMLGNRFYRQADVYFHRGLDYQNPESQLSDSIFARLHNELEPNSHLHAENKSEIREIMPWLELTMRINPDDLESQVVAAYWLWRHLERPDLAENVLLRAQRDNPYAFEIQIEKARLYLHQANWPQAQAALNAALGFWEKTGNPEEEADRLAKGEALMMRALLLEADNRIADAIGDYKALLRLFPEREGPRQRLALLMEQTTPHPAADVVLSRLIDQSEKHHHCEHDDHQQSHHEHADDHHTHHP